MYPSEKYQSVMVVDDEEGVRLSCDRLLSERGFDVTTVEDGSRAINRLTERPVDVVVSDLRMPGLDGLQLLEWLHERQPSTRFILLTGYGSEEVERKARALGAYGYLSKPIRPDELSAMIEAAAEVREQEQAVAEVVAVEAKAEPQREEIPTPQPQLASVDSEVEGENEGPGVGKVLAWLLMGPILGLAFVIFLPVIGIGAFLWVLAQAIRKRFTPAQA